MHPSLNLLKDMANSGKPLTTFGVLHEQLKELWNNVLQDGTCHLYDYIHVRVQISFNTRG